MSAIFIFFRPFSMPILDRGAPLLAGNITLALPVRRLSRLCLQFTNLFGQALSEMRNAHQLKNVHLSGGWDFVEAPP